LLLGRPKTVIANYFGFKFTSPSGEERIHKYKVTANPDLPPDSPVLKKLVKLTKKKLEDHLGFCVQFRDCIYSLVNLPEVPTVSLYGDKDQSTSYQMKATWVQQIKKEDVDMLIFFKIFLNRLMERGGLIQVGFGKHFDPSRSRDLKDCQVWPGYSTALSTFQSGVLFTVNPTNKFIMERTAYDVIKGTRSGGNTKENIAKELHARGVMTTYNRRVYRVEEVSYDHSPKDTFLLKENKMTREVSYIDYYKEKYNVEIKDHDQPLLVHVNEKTMQKIFLIPETCMLTGITDELKAKNSRDMRDILFANAEVKYKRIETYFEHLLNHEKCKQMMEQWKVTICNKPTEIDAVQLHPGKILINNGQSIDLSRTPDFDREIKNLMDMPKLNKWAIFYPRRFKKEAESLMKELQNCLRDFKYPCNPPRRVEIENDRADTWCQSIDDTLKDHPDTSCAIFIIQGKKKASPVYHELKKKLVEEVPIPSQMILADTLSRGKGIRSIANKLFIQCNAKFGGTPWGFDKLPLCDKPTMFCGIDVFKKCKAKGCSYSAFVASTDKYCGKFHSEAQWNSEGDDLGAKLGQSVINSIEKFKERNGAAPERIVVFRDGVSESQLPAVLSTECGSIKDALDNAGFKETGLIFLVVNQTCGARFFCKNGNRNVNPDRGIVVDSGVVKECEYDFYIVPHGSRQGIQGPTRFHLLYSNEEIDTKSLYEVCYRLCYGYFNYGSSIKVPSPVLYAHKLAYFLGEIENKHGQTMPQDVLTEKLYYI
jgi:aubergine-like protein